jgi:hypothetical protein
MMETKLVGFTPIGTLPGHDLPLKLNEDIICFYGSKGLLTPFPTQIISSTYRIQDRMNVDKLDAGIS